MIPWETIGTFFNGLSEQIFTIPRLYCLMAVLLGYFIGMLQPAYLIAKIKKVPIARDCISKPYSSNRYRCLGFGWALLIFLFDAAKVVGAVFLAHYLFILQMQLPIPAIVITLYAGLGVILGHDFPVYLRFRGGKGAFATCLVYACLFDIKYAIVGAFVFILIFLITRYVSLTSICVVILLMFTFLLSTLMNWTFVEREWLFDCQAITIAFSVLILITHAKNIARVLYAEEERFRFIRKKEEDVEEEAEQPVEEPVQLPAAEPVLQTEAPVKVTPLTLALDEMGSEIAADLEEGILEEEADDTADEIIEEVIEEVSEETEEIQEAIEEKTKEAVDTVEEVISEAEEAPTAEAEIPVEEMQDSAVETVEETQEVIEEAAQEAQDIAEDAEEGIEPAEDDTETEEEAIESEEKAAESEEETEQTDDVTVETTDEAPEVTSSVKKSQPSKKKKHSTTKKKKSNSTKKKRK